MSGLGHTEVETLVNDLLREHDMQEIEFEVVFDPASFTIGIPMRLRVGEGSDIASSPVLPSRSPVEEIEKTVLAGIAHIYKLAYDRTKVPA